jgi:phosphopantothenoylcysteine decarboxylase
VATVLARKMAHAFRDAGHEVQIIFTEAGLKICPYGEWHKLTEEFKVWKEKDEWTWDVCRTQWRKDDPVVHIELRKWADVMVIAPLSANTMGKIVNGLCDNLLTSVVRAWDWEKQFIVAPAMNTFMWESPITGKQVKELVDLGATIVPPIAKTLACGDEGVGAMARIETVVEALVDAPT